MIRLSLEGDFGQGRVRCDSTGAARSTYSEMVEAKTIGLYSFFKGRKRRNS
jgi:hypothetical protein